MKIKLSKTNGILFLVRLPMTRRRMATERVATMTTKETITTTTTTITRSLMLLMLVRMNKNEHKATIQQINIISDFNKIDLNIIKSRSIDCYIYHSIFI